MGNLTEILLIRKTRLSKEAEREALLKPFLDLILDLNTKKVKINIDSTPHDLIDSFTIGKFHLSFTFNYTHKPCISIGVTEEEPYQLQYRFLANGSMQFTKYPDILMKKLLEVIEPYLIIPGDEARKDINNG